MTTTIGIIGLGQIGGSIGLALKARREGERIIGHDRDRATARNAESIGAIDAAKGLREVARESQVLFLCLPLEEMQQVLSSIGPELRESAVVLDTAPIKSQVIMWAREFVPAGRYYIGLVPAINADLLAGTELGIKAARAELFRRTVMMIMTPPGTPAGVEQLGMNVARMLGAKPMLTDPVEADGIMTTAHVLPQLAAAALIEATAGRAGWLEARKLAGRPFTGVTGGIEYFDTPVSLQAAASANRERTVHGLDVLIAALQGLREDIHKEDGPGVAERLKHSQAARRQWLEERAEAGWLLEGNEPVQLPGLGQQITQMLFGGRIAEVTSNIAEKLEGKK